MEKDVFKIIQSWAESAQNATEDAYDYMQKKGKSAGEAVSEKTAAVRYGLEAARLRAEQEHKLAEVGRMMFLVRSGEAKENDVYLNTGKTPQQIIDGLFIDADQYQQQIDALNAKIAEIKAKSAEKGKNICAKCGHECAEGAVFCSHCGAKL